MLQNVFKFRHAFCACAPFCSCWSHFGLFRLMVSAVFFGLRFSESLKCVPKIRKCVSYFHARELVCNGFIPSTLCVRLTSDRRSIECKTITGNPKLLKIRSSFLCELVFLKQHASEWASNFNAYKIISFGSDFVLEKSWRLRPNSMTSILLI